MSKRSEKYREDEIWLETVWAALKGRWWAKPAIEIADEVLLQYRERVKIGLNSPKKSKRSPKRVKQ